MIELEKFPLKQLAAIFFVSLVVGVVLVNWFEYIVPNDNSLPLGVDFYPRWVGSRAFWRGESPYSLEVDRETQSYVFNRPALPGEDTFGFYYPAHIAVVLGPLTLLSARAGALLWTAVTWALLGVLVFLIIRSVPGRASPGLFLLIALSVFFQRSILLVVLNGQYVLFVLACWGLAYYLVQHKQNAAAGFLLALTTIKPSLSVLPLLVFLWWVWRTRRRSVVLSFLVTCGLFFAVTLVQIGWWLPEFVLQLGQYDNFPRQWIPANIFTLSGVIWLGSTAVLVFLGIRDHRQDPFQFPWLLFWASISLVLLATPHTAEYDLPALLLPLFIYSATYLRTRFGTAVWAFLLWWPWISWTIFQLLGETTSYWYSFYWFHYPQVLVIALIAFHYFVNQRLVSQRPSLKPKITFRESIRKRN